MEDDIFRKTPCATEAEKAVLSCLLKSPEEFIPQAVESMVPEFFYVPANRIIYETLIGLSGHAVDLPILITTLRDQGTLDQVGGPSEVANLLDDIPSVRLFGHYRAQLKEKFVLREIIRKCGELASAGYENSESPDSLLAELEQAGAEIRKDVEIGTELPQIHETVVDSVTHLEELFRRSKEGGGTLAGLSSGLKTLDFYTLGFQPGRVYVFAARPKMGKTSLLRQIILEGLKEAPVLFHSMEMSRRDIVTSYFGSIGQVDLTKLALGAISDEEWARILKASVSLSKLGLWIDDRLLTGKQIAASARKYARKEGIRLLAVDYAQLALPEGRAERENEQIKIQNFSNLMVGLSKELDIPIVVLAQLNRDAEGLTARKLHMGMLKGCGALEQDAAMLGLLGESEQKDTEDLGQDQLRSMKILGRFCPPGVIDLYFEPHYVTFHDVAKDEDN